MELRLALATSLDEIGFGYADEFVDLGFTSLMLGFLHLQFSVDTDRVEQFQAALGSPWSAFRACMFGRGRSLINCSV